MLERLVRNGWRDDEPGMLALIIWFFGIGADFVGAGATILAACISGVFTVIAAVIAASVVMLQIRHQAKVGRDHIARAEALRLKLKIYEDVTATVSNITERCIAFGGVCQNIGFQVRSAATGRNANFPPTLRYPAVSELYMETANAGVEIISTVERWLIIEPGIEVFQAAANVALTDLRIAFSEQLVPILFRVLPIDYEDGVLPWDPPPLQVVDHLDEALAEVQNAVSALQMYGEDFQREMQNILVGDLGKQRISPRQPMDPKMIVPTLANRQAAMDFFNSDQTAYGRLKIEAIASVRANMAARGSGQEV